MTESARIATAVASGETPLGIGQGTVLELVENTLTFTMAQSSSAVNSGTVVATQGLLPSIQSGVEKRNKADAKGSSTDYKHVLALLKVTERGVEQL